MSRQSISDYLRNVDPTKYDNEESILQDNNVKQYANAVSDLCNNPESGQTLDNYKNSVLKILF